MVASYVVWPVMVWYGASLGLDLYGTLRAGRGAISRREVAMPFRIVTVRAGPAAAAGAQVALEMCLALAAAPLVLGHDILHLPAAAAFCGAAAASHTYGFVSNCAYIPR
ncbi:MAG: hypothetical protein J4G04_03270 [Nitrosopumilaceae archaeon]|nr:hypothetical protein [Nitrosopumilaceae archaeon]